MSKKNKKSEWHLPLWSKIFLCLALLSALIRFVGTKSTAFAEWITVNVGFYIRRALAELTGGFKISLAEVLIILSPVILVLILFVASKRKGIKAKVSFLVCLLSVISLFYTGYVYTLGIGYHRTSLSSRIAVDAADVNEESLYKTLLILSSECENLIGDIEYSESGSSVSDIDFDTMCEEVLKGYERLDRDFPELNIQNFDSIAKPVNLSAGMTKLDLLGVYTYFTGESNVNVHYPDYNIPFTIAHELAHQRGIARENEANFIAFLVCIRADSPYVRYSGFINMFEYVLSSLGRTSVEKKREILNDIPDKMRGEMIAQSKFYQENKSELLGKISELVNDNYLKAQGTEGVVSYGLVTELCVAYYATSFDSAD